MKSILSNFHYYRWQLYTSQTSISQLISQKASCFLSDIRVAYAQAKSNSWDHMQIDLLMPWYYTAQKYSRHQLFHNSNHLWATLWVGVIIHLPMVQRKDVTQLLQNPSLLFKQPFDETCSSNVNQQRGWECHHQMVTSNWGQILATDAISQTEINGAWIIVLGFDWPHQLTHRG